MSESDNKIFKLLSEDNLPFEADTSIKEQLNYHLQLKLSTSKVKQNSIFSFISILFTTKMLGFKVSVAAIALFALIGYKQLNKPAGNFPIVDTLSSSKSIDSTGAIFVGDSAMFYQ